MKFFIIGCVLCGLIFVSEINADAIYQCEQQDGATVYQGTPCEEGKTLAVQGDDAAEDAGGNYSMWVGPNYVDTSHSALLQATSVQAVASDSRIQRNIPFGWKPYHVSVEVLEVFRGELQTGQNLKLLIYLSWPMKSQLAKIQDTFLLSFCRSNGGVFYTSRDYLVMTPSRDNVGEFRRIRDHGTDYEGPGDCSSSNYPSLNPDSHSS